MAAIETKKLTKKFKDKVAVNEIDLKIKQGELFALLGVNGAGKTTTIKMLSGLILPTSGGIMIENMNMKKDIFKIKEILNVSPQETAIAPNLTVKENLDICREALMEAVAETSEEFMDWRSHFVISKSDLIGLRRPPYAFTEEGGGNAIWNT